MKNIVKYKYKVEFEEMTKEKYYNYHPMNGFACPEIGTTELTLGFNERLAEIDVRDIFLIPLTKITEIVV